MNDIQQIDDYLFKNASAADATLFEARLILQPDLQQKMKWQQQTYDIIQQYSRRQLKAEIEAVHQKLFNEPRHRSFRQRIMHLFVKD